MNPILDIHFVYRGLGEIVVDVVKKFSRGGDPCRLLSGEFSFDNFVSSTRTSWTNLLVAFTFYWLYYWLLLTILLTIIATQLECEILYWDGWIGDVEMYTSRCRIKNFHLSLAPFSIDRGDALNVLRLRRNRSKKQKRFESKTCVL